MSLLMAINLVNPWTQPNFFKNIMIFYIIQFLYRQSHCSATGNSCQGWLIHYWGSVTLCGGCTKRCQWPPCASMRTQPTGPTSLTLSQPSLSLPKVLILPHHPPIPPRPPLELIVIVTTMVIVLQAHRGVGAGPTGERQRAATSQLFWGALGVIKGRETEKGWLQRRSSGARTGVRK